MSPLTDSGSTEAASGTCEDSSVLSIDVARLLVARAPRGRRVFLGVAILRPEGVGGALLGEAERRVRRRVDADSGGGKDAPLVADGVSFITKRGGVAILFAGS